jgi:hypothetical protein
LSSAGAQPPSLLPQCCGGISSEGSIGLTARRYSFMLSRYQPGQAALQELFTLWYTDEDSLHSFHVSQI